jgi:hypothetical protein
MANNERMANMPASGMSKLTCCNVTKGRRVTLPPLLEDIQENDQLQFKKVDGGYFVSKLERLSADGSIQKKELFGVIIGQSQVNYRWYGIVIDRYGLIKLRVSSSSQMYLIKDMVELTEQKYRDKLNEKCGVNGWAFPILVKYPEYKELNQDMLKTVNECVDGLHERTWPPVSGSEYF